jgi:hypothetical protein
MKRERNIWHKKLSDMIKICKNQGIAVKFVPDAKTRDYIGMNPEAGKDIGFKMPARTLYVDRNLDTQEKYEVLRHELVEYNAMKDKGLKYFPAHVIALNDERKITEQGC